MITCKNTFVSERTRDLSFSCFNLPPRLQSLIVEIPVCLQLRYFHGVCVSGCRGLLHADFTCIHLFSSGFSMGTCRNAFEFTKMKSQLCLFEERHGCCSRKQRFFIVSHSTWTNVGLPDLSELPLLKQRWVWFEVEEPGPTELHFFPKRKQFHSFKLLGAGVFSLLCFCSVLSFMFQAEIRRLGA